MLKLLFRMALTILVDGRMIGTGLIAVFLLLEMVVFAKENFLMVRCTVKALAKVTIWVIMMVNGKIGFDTVQVL